MERRSYLWHPGSIASGRVSPQFSPFNKAHPESGNSSAGAGATVNDALRAGTHPVFAEKPDLRCKPSRIRTYEIGAPNCCRMNTYTKIVGGGVPLAPGESQECGVPSRNQDTRRLAHKLCRMNTYTNNPGGVGGNARCVLKS